MSKGSPNITKANHGFFRITLIPIHSNLEAKLRLSHKTSPWKPLSRRGGRRRVAGMKPFLLMIVSVALVGRYGWKFVEGMLPYCLKG